VGDDAIRCNGHGYGFLRWEHEVGDFILTLDFKLKPGANSGVGIRHARYTGERESRPSFSGYEIQLLDDADQAPSTHSSGSLYRYLAPKVQAMKPAGRWNRLIVECRGPHIAVTLNDQVIHDLDQTSIQEIANNQLRGYISLQNHGSEVVFRNARLKGLE
jgi:hypothetical protein